MRLCLNDLMGNLISSFFSGFGKVIGDLFNSPLDFLAGKSCRYMLFSVSCYFAMPYGGLGKDSFNLFL